MCLIICFRSLFSPLCLNCACFKCICRIQLCEPKKCGRNYFDALWIKEHSKSGSKTPNMNMSWQMPQFWMIQQRSNEGKLKTERARAHYSQTVVGVTVRGVLYGQTMMAPLPILANFLRGCSCPAPFRRYRR